MLKQMTNSELVSGLRELADWYENHADAPLPVEVQVKVSTISGKGELAAFARMLGTCTKDSNEIFFYVRRAFGPVVLSGFDYRESVCQRVVTGKRTVEVDVPVGYRKETREEEVVEWHCPETLLAEAAEQK